MITSPRRTKLCNIVGEVSFKVSFKVSFSPGSHFKDQISTGELSGVDSFIIIFIVVIIIVIIIIIIIIIITVIIIIHDAVKAKFLTNKIVTMTTVKI